MLMAMPEKKPEAHEGMPKFPIPDGFQPPDDVGEGESFDVTCRVYVKDGQVCVEDINGVGTTKEEKEETPEEEATENEADEESGNPPSNDTSSPGGERTIDDAIAAMKGRK